WKAVAGILLANIIYFLGFAKEFKELAARAPKTEIPGPATETKKEPVPFLITIVHLLALVWTVFNSHYPILFIGVFFFFIVITPFYSSAVSYSTWHSPKRRNTSRTSSI